MDRSRQGHPGARGQVGLEGLGGRPPEIESVGAPHRCIKSLGDGFAIVWIVRRTQRHFVVPGDAIVERIHNVHDGLIAVTHGDGTATTRHRCGEIGSSLNESLAWQHNHEVFGGEIIDRVFARSGSAVAADTGCLEGIGPCPPVGHGKGFATIGERSWAGNDCERIQRRERHRGGAVID